MSSSSSNHLLIYLISTLLITLQLCPCEEAALLTSPVVGEGEYFCDLGGTYANNTIFETNLNLLLSSLTIVTPTTAIFYDAKGQAPDQVFGFAACLGDHHRDCSECLCRACLSRLVRHTRRSCANKKQAILVSRGCALSYSIESLDEDRDGDADGHLQQEVLPGDVMIETIDNIEADLTKSEIESEDVAPETAQLEPLFMVVTLPEEGNVLRTEVEEEKEELPDTDVVDDSDDRQLPVESQVLENLQEEMTMIEIENETTPAEQSMPLSQPPPTLMGIDNVTVTYDETPMTTTPLLSIDIEEAQESEGDILASTIGRIPTTFPTFIPSKKTFSPPNTEAAEEPVPSFDSVPAPTLTVEETEPPLAPSVEEETKPPPPPLEETKPPPSEQASPRQKKRSFPSRRTKRSPTTSRSPTRSRRPKSKEGKKNPSPVMVFKFLSVIAVLIIVYLFFSWIWSSSTVSKKDLGRSRFQETSVPKGWGRNTFLNRKTRRD